MPQLDALRALAVGGVLIHHGLNAGLLPSVFFWISLGGYGVKLFFVLSGFLITGILLRARPSSDDSSPWHAIRQFYIRRLLRIFPLYYFVCAVLFLFNVTPVREELWWLLTYTINYRAAVLGWYPGYVGHFWSLAVEEQFYLFWPWVVLFVPTQWLVPSALTMILVGPVYRLFALLWQMNGVAFYAVTFSSFDALGIGAALAILSGGVVATTQLRRTLSFYVLPTALTAAVALNILVTQSPFWTFLYYIFFETALALIFGWLVAGASFGFSGVTGNFLGLKPLQYCGKIAYGIYVYHYLLRIPIYDAGVWLGFDWKLGGYLNFTVLAVVTIAVASLSWHLMEKPINALKARFNYDAASSTSATPTASRTSV